MPHFLTVFFPLMFLINLLVVEERVEEREEGWEREEKGGSMTMEGEGIGKGKEGLKQGRRKRGWEKRRWEREREGQRMGGIQRGGGTDGDIEERGENNEGKTSSSPCPSS